MRDKKHDAESKSSNREDKRMSTAYIDTAKGMAGFVLEREYRGPGDTIEAAAYRAQHKYGVAATLLMRLRHREVRDMLMSNFMNWRGPTSRHLKSWMGHMNAKSPWQLIRKLCGWLILWLARKLRSK